MARRVPTILDFLAPAVELSRMAAEAQMVIALRMAGMAGFWPMGQAEGQRMVTEKMQAAMAASRAAVKAGMAGQGPADVAMAAMKPVRRRTRANAARLTRKATGG
jgi:hypothetical protein